MSGTFLGDAFPFECTSVLGAHVGIVDARTGHESSEDDKAIAINL